MDLNLTHPQWLVARDAPWHCVGLIGGFTVVASYNDRRIHIDWHAAEGSTSPRKLLTSATVLGVG
eukprot:4351606-Pyramimonas_sp.AAC.1